EQTSAVWSRSWVVFVSFTGALLTRARRASRTQPREAGALESYETRLRLPVEEGAMPKLQGQQTPKPPCIVSSAEAVLIQYSQDCGMVEQSTFASSLVGQ